MGFSYKVLLAVVASLLSIDVSAHPGHDATAEMAERSAFMGGIGRRSLTSCTGVLQERGVYERAGIRRRAAAEKLRKERSIDSLPFLKARDLDTVLATSHDSNRTDAIPGVADDVLFDNSTCALLSPEVTQGPYWVSGEYVRSNVTESQTGVSLIYEVQLIDVSTCSPLSNVYLETWHCNATGVYSGVIADGNGDSSDESNLNATFLRGISSTDSDGVVTFDTIFPGHYTGRTNHIHVLGHLNATVNTANNTLASSGNIIHVGQVFFDTDLIDLVEATAPYTANTQNVTTNEEDSILAQEAADVDPMLEYVMLGDDVSAGLFGWIVIGVDSSYDFTDITPAATLTSDGGEESDSSPFGGAPGNGTGA